MSGRLATLSVLQLLQAVLDRLAALSSSSSSPPPPPPSSPTSGAAAAASASLVHVVDAKPLPVGGYSKDHDARWGHAAAGHKAKGYKWFDIWGNRVVPTAWTLGPMNLAEPDVARVELLPRLAFGGVGVGVGGYLLGDQLYDSNPLHQACGVRGIQLVAPRKKPGTGLGHREHQPGRPRAIELLEMHVPGDLPGAGPPAPFGHDLYRLRGDIERRQGNLCSFGGGLAPLPAWVRRPRRVARWVAVKLAINGLRQCKLQGLTAKIENVGSTGGGRKWGERGGAVVLWHVLE
jgi:hypothetical protein